MSQTSEAKERRGPKFPTAFTILFGLIVLVAILTWVIPAGQYERVYSEDLGRDVPVAGTFAETEPNPQGLFDPHGAHRRAHDPFTYEANAIDIAVFVMVLGNLIGVVTSTGAISAGIARAMVSLGKGKVADPCADGALRLRWNHLWHGGRTLAFSDPDTHHAGRPL